MKIEIENKTKSKKEGGKKIKKKEEDNISELRQDIVTGDWVVIATKRAKRPEDFAKSDRENVSDKDDIENCFFCEPEKTGQEKDVLIYRTSDKDWTLRVFPNKYPAFSRGKVPRSMEEGPYFAMTGTGYHEKHQRTIDPEADRITGDEGRNEGDTKRKTYDDRSIDCSES